ncbi:MAG: hypothetical protein GON13_00520 [Nanoarchaeota archaeon]|nr:hypothetical protein [Nanoarchaeota archaeon]
MFLSNLEKLTVESDKLFDFGKIIKHHALVSNKNGFSEENYSNVKNVLEEINDWFPNGERVKFSDKEKNLFIDVSIFYNNLKNQLNWMVDWQNKLYNDINPIKKLDLDLEEEEKKIPGIKFLYEGVIGDYQKSQEQIKILNNILY